MDPLPTFTQSFPSLLYGAKKMHIQPDHQLSDVDGAVNIVEADAINAADALDGADGVDGADDEDRAVDNEVTPLRVFVFIQVVAAFVHTLSSFFLSLSSFQTTISAFSSLCPTSSTPFLPY